MRRDACLSGVAVVIARTHPTAGKVRDVTIVLDAKGLGGKIGHDSFRGSARLSPWASEKHRPILSAVRTGNESGLDSFTRSFPMAYRSRADHIVWNRSGPESMSIYATLWQLKFPRYGVDHTDCEWIDVTAQGVPAHIGSPTPGCGYETGDPYSDFLP